MYDKVLEHYDVNIYEKTIFNEYHYIMTKNFPDIESAIDFAKKETTKGNRVKIEEIYRILNWDK